MTWTWDTSSLATSALQQVRATIGDTDTNDQLLSDEQINWRLTQSCDAVLSAAVTCVQDILAKLTRETDRSNVGMSSSRSQKFQQYKDLLAELKAKASGTASITLGSLSVSGDSTILSDSDFKRPKFRVDQDSNTSSDYWDDET